MNIYSVYLDLHFNIQLFKIVKFENIAQIQYTVFSGI